MSTGANRARQLRKNTTWAEKVLWRHLRARRTENCKFRRQYPEGPYILDFFCSELSLAIEMDGSEHGLPERAQRDRTRDEYLNNRGIRVIRFWNFQIRENLDGILQRVRMEIDKRRAELNNPHPNPLPGGEGADA